MRHIWQQKAWPQMTWSAKELERVHFQAPPAERLSDEMRAFLDAVNADPILPPLVGVALAHLRQVGQGRSTHYEIEEEGS